MSKLIETCQCINCKESIRRYGADVIVCYCCDGREHIECIKNRLSDSLSCCIGCEKQYEMCACCHDLILPKPIYSTSLDKFDDNIKNKMTRWSLCCRHLIHENCMNNWVSVCFEQNRKITCPLCNRNQITSNMWFDNVEWLETPLYFLAIVPYTKDILDRHIWHYIGPVFSEGIDYSHDEFEIVLQGIKYNGVRIPKNTDFTGRFMTLCKGHTPPYTFSQRHISKGTSVLDVLTKKTYIIENDLTPRLVPDTMRFINNDRIGKSLLDYY